MRIGMLSQWFDPEPGPAAIPGVLAREFIRSGHQVSVLTGFPNYPEGKIYPEFDGRRRATSTVGSIEITRVPLFASHSGSGLGRIANYASFSLSATALGRAAMKDVDVIWVYNSPITVSAPLLVHSKWGRKPIFLQVQDLWPDSLIESGMFPGGNFGKIAASLVSSIVRLTENRSAVVGVSSEGARRLLIERNPRLDPARIISTPNPTDETLFRPVNQIDQAALPDVPWKGYFTIMYVGAVGDVQGLESVIAAARILRQDDRIRFVVVGDGIARRRLTDQVHSDGLRNVTFLGRVEKALVPGLMATASVQLVSLAARKFLDYTTPSKISSLLASGVPIIGQLSGDGARLISDAGAGILAEPENGESLAAAVNQMAALSHRERGQFGENGSRFYAQNLSAKVIASRVVASLMTV